MQVLHKDAIFIADAHDNVGRKILLPALQEVQTLSPSQLFLMGDIFDLLVGEVAYTRHVYAAEITLINTLCESMDVYYFEGNHDFRLQNIFPKVQVFSLSKQPQLFAYKQKTIALAHGDTYEGLGYNLYTAIIRNPFLLTLLDFLDTRIENRISKSILSRLTQKHQCRKMDSFENHAQKRLHLYKEVDYVVEGHFHQNKTYKNYNNLPSLACEKKLQTGTLFALI